MTARSSCWLRCKPTTNRWTNFGALSGSDGRVSARSAREHVEGGQFLTDAVMQVLTDPALFQRRDLDDFELEFLPPADVAQEAGIELQMSHLADGQIQREGRSILAAAVDFTSVADHGLFPRFRM